MGIRRLVPAVIRGRYAVKFGIALLILGLTVGTIGLVATATVTDEVEQLVQDDHNTAVQQEAQSLQMWHEQNQRTANLIATSDVVESDDTDAIEDSLGDWRLEHRTEVFEISYVDTSDDAVLASTAARFRDESTDVFVGVPDDAYESLDSSPTWVSKPYIAEDHNGEETPVVTYVVAPPAHDDRAIVYTVDLVSYMQRVHVNDHVTMMALDGDDDVMADSEHLGDAYGTFGLEYGNASLPATARESGAHTGITEESPSGALAADVYGFDTEEYVVSAAPVEGTDWVVVYHEPTEQAYGFVSAVSDWGLAATGFSVVIIGLIGAVLGRNTARSIDRLTEKVEQIEEGNLNVDLETERIDNIGRLYDGFDSMRDALREHIKETEAAREEAERERERIQAINDQLETTADDYSDVMEAAAEGNLTARMEADTENEAMADIAEDFNEMLEEIERTVAELNRFATDVATASEQVTASSEEVRSASQQVTESIQEISDGADRQNESLQSVNQEMSALSTTTEEIAASSNEVADIAERTVDTGQQGQEAAQAAITAMDEIEDEAGDAVDEIRRLEEEVQQIDELINTISEIARQTNMLALNANIEASRSADGNSDDEGFSVVAKEVKALSEDVAEAADEAEDRLEAIRNRTEASAAEVADTSSDIETASDQVQNAVEALEEIATLAQETNVGVQEISAATEEQAASTQEVVAMVDDAATISEETTSEAENVAAAAEEQTTALTEVTKSASNLSEQAAQLSEALDRFDTGLERADLDLESTFDVDADLVATESAYEVDDAESDDQAADRSITFDEADDGGAEAGDEGETNESVVDAVDADSTAAAEATAEVESAEPAAPVESDESEPGETDTPAAADRHDDADELDAGEILGIDGQATDEGETGSPDAAESADPLAEALDDATAQPLDRTEGSDGDADQATADAGDTADGDESSDETEAEPEPADGADESDGDESDGDESDDVFTFGQTADDE
ncbi:methyl-accepting chemotaxis protein [Natrinema salifodinae]|uniref:Methyl-accepting chemotaxis protein n=1 Tax=Natrinema salifodinae TaxID=1202768 RepID=A0A1I0PHI9_9EURY|nr:methyl-accepting chemotaxis protein [Natrinema salifodinae]SEW13838.1 methyl-accepting chemotaxis protein [Natrinema salifodinae]